MDNDSLDTARARQILAKRATLIAKEKIETSEAIKSAVLVFGVGSNQKYGIVYEAIDKVITEQSITPVPGANPLFAGLIYHNAEVWTVIDSDVLFNCAQRGDTLNFVLLRVGTYRYALSVGTIIGQVPYDESIELIHFSTENARQQSFVRGVYKTDITLVDIMAVFNILNTIQVAE